MDYCASLEWLKGDKKIKDGFVETDMEGPYQIPMKERPQKWVYSKANFHVWLKGDSTHAPVYLDGLRLFPYMMMENGHHHGAAYMFEEGSEVEGYQLSQLALHGMRGCWSIRGTFSEEDSMETSFLVTKIMSYKNLSEEGNAEVMGFCMNEGGGDHGGGHHDHH